MTKKLPDGDISTLCPRGHRMVESKNPGYLWCDECRTHYVPGQATTDGAQGKAHISPNAGKGGSAVG